MEWKNFRKEVPRRATAKAEGTATRGKTRQRGSEDRREEGGTLEGEDGEGRDQAELGRHPRDAVVGDGQDLKARERAEAGRQLPQLVVLHRELFLPPPATPTRQTNLTKPINVAAAAAAAFDISRLSVELHARGNGRRPRRRASL